jgi:hypothetical protein
LKGKSVDLSNVKPAEAELSHRRIEDPIKSVALQCNLIKGGYNPTYTKLV